MALMLAMLLRLALPAALLLSSVFAGGIPVRGSGSGALLSLTQLAREFGQVPTVVGDSVTLRLPEGVLTLWEGEGALLWFPRSGEPVEKELARPTTFSDGHWWVSTQLAAVLGGSVSGRTLLLPGRARLLLDLPGSLGASGASGAGSQQIRLPHNVQALSLTSGEQTLLLVDLGLLGLAYPDQQAEIDAFTVELAGQQALYFVLTSQTENSWEANFILQQGGTLLHLQHPWEVALLDGDEQLVAPARPVSGVMLLPASVNLRAALTVTWQDTAGTTVFRH